MACLSYHERNYHVNAIVNRMLNIITSVHFINYMCSLDMTLISILNVSVYIK